MSVEGGGLTPTYGYAGELEYPPALAPLYQSLSPKWVVEKSPFRILDQMIGREVGLLASKENSCEGFGMRSSTFSNSIGKSKGSPKTSRMS